MTKQAKNIFYAQSGGVTAVINASACGVIETARKHPEQFDKIYVGKNGILGALHEELIDTSLETPEAIRALYHTPGGAFGSCRYKLKSIEQNRAEYERLIDIFKAHDIGTFFYNGGGDSQDTANKVAEFSKSMGLDIRCIGVPKTVDNDLPFTDNCPGFGSVAKYIAVSTREASLDVASMAETSTKVFILEVMGRHAGWIAAAGALAQDASKNMHAPHIILFPEMAFNKAAFLAKVDATVKQHGYCVVVASEGVKDESGKFLAETGTKDAFGHAQLGGVAPYLATLVQTELKLKYHWAVADYLQRAARHLSSKVDVEQAYALGKAAVEFALEGKTAIMPIVVRDSTTPYKWSIGEVALSKVANVEHKLPRNFIDDEGFGITEACRAYLLPLIQGEAYPPYENGMPDYVVLKNQLISKKLPSFEQKK